MNNLYLVVLLSVAILLPHESHAYLDPGSGSIVTQFLLGIVVGSLFFIKQIIFYVKNTFAKIFGLSKSDPKS